jgi:hypothetical protein
MQPEFKLQLKGPTAVMVDWANAGKKIWVRKCDFATLHKKMPPRRRQGAQLREVY